MITGSPTLHMRLPSLCMQALGLGYSTVWANRAGSLSTRKLSLAMRTLSSGCDGFPSEPHIVFKCLYNASMFGIIQGCALEGLHQNRMSLTKLALCGHRDEPILWDG